ncbi:MAG: glycogen synthase GlgA [Pseudomonadota bacterium]
MRVLSVASECAPLIKTGGLADVVGALPSALSAEGVETTVMLPAYRRLAERLEGARAHALADAPGRLLSGRAEGLSVILHDAPELFDRDGGPYAGPDGRDWRDNAQRFGAFARAAAEAAAGAAGISFDVAHAHDWQAGPVPALLRLRGGPASVMTIHNIAFQGLFGPEALEAAGLPRRLMRFDGVEQHGRVGYLKAGLQFADRVTTVSPRYARELTTAEFGYGLEALLRWRGGDFSGVLNGIDEAVWNPASDPALPAAFSARDLSGKAACRAALRERFGLRATDGPIFIVVSRMTRQKGLDLLLDALPTLLAEGGALALLGSGDVDLEAGFAAAARDHPGRVSCVVGYDEPLAHLMQGGGDAILVPSRFEPCGLTQLIGLRYGAIPVVARTGGLGDTVIDANPAALAVGAATGVVHAPGRGDALAEAIRRTCALHRDDAAWAGLRRAAMRHPVGWGPSAARYAALYREAAEASAARRGTDREAG